MLPALLPILYSLAPLYRTCQHLDRLDRLDSMRSALLEALSERLESLPERLPCPSSEVSRSSQLVKLQGS